MSSDLEKLIAETLLEVKRLTVEVAQLRAIVAGSPTVVEGWTDPTKAANSLQNEGIKNARHLQRLRLEGVFSEARGEIRNVSAGDRPTWEYNVPSCRKALRRHFGKMAG